MHVSENKKELSVYVPLTCKTIYNQSIEIFLPANVKMKYVSDF